jgi:predicted TIM-barrel fold metal-dependent hydrolase
MILDLDSHLREEYFMDEVYRLEGPYARFTPVRVGDGKYQEAKFIHHLNPVNAKVAAAFDHSYMYDPKRKWRGGEIAERQVGGYDMGRRLQDNAREGIDHQILFPTLMGIPATNVGGLGAALCRSYNDWVTRLVRGHEDRLWPVAIGPAGCPDEMANELRRCVKELGMKAAHLVPYCGPRNLDDPAFFPYYEAAEDLGVPLFCHPQTLGELTDRFDNFFSMHVLGRPMNCTPALVALVCGGVFERFPRLRVAFFECSAEWILYWMHRMDEDYEWAKDDLARHLPMPPSEYVRRNCYVTCEADERHLGLALEEIGEDHVCVATDYPHFDSEFPRTVSSIRSRSDLTARQKDKILGENAARLLNL